MPEIKHPDIDCRLCPRLAAFRDENKQKFPSFYNGPVRPFGDEDAALLIIGLAPGLKGANATARPFTGDYAGDLLYSTLKDFGFAKGEYKADPQDGLTLINARITNGVKCVPPQNKPVGAEINTCRPFLQSELAAMTNLKAILCLGKISHDTTLKTLGHRIAPYPFKHAARYDLDVTDIAGNARQISLFDSYHCSRYNTNTGRLTTEMFHDVFRGISDCLD